MTDHDPLRLHDLEREILVLVISAVGSMQRQFPTPARPKLELVNGAPETDRSPPSSELLRVAKSAKNLRA
jgi:hypothetical protein